MHINVDLVSPDPVRPGRWMEDLKDVLGPRSLREVTIPGSHNSGSDVLAEGPAPGAPSAYAAMPCFIRKWSECQSADVGAQLQGGVRYVDLRTAAVPGKEGLRVVHALCGGPMRRVLDQVAAFVASTTHEIVVVDFQHFYGLATEDHAGLLDTCLALFGPAACIPPGRAGASLESLWAAEQRVLLLWGDKAFAPTRPNVLHERPLAIRSPWAGAGQTASAASRRRFKARLEGYVAAAEGDTAVRAAVRVWAGRRHGRGLAPGGLRDLHAPPIARQRLQPRARGLAAARLGAAVRQHSPP